MNYDDYIVANFSLDQLRGLRRLVAAALGFGGVTSIAANVVHSITTAAPDEAKWRIWAGGGWAALAPIVLAFAIEMASRIPVTGKVLGQVRIGATVAIAGMSAWISYWSIVSVAQFLGEHDWAKQYLYPGLIDGMMAVGTVSLIELARIKRLVVSHNAEADAVALARRLADEQAAQAAAAAMAAKVAATANKLVLTPARGGRPAEAGTQARPLRQEDPRRQDQLDQRVQREGPRAARQGRARQAACGAGRADQPRRRPDDRPAGRRRPARGVVPVEPVWLSGREPHPKEPCVPRGQGRAIAPGRDGSTLVRREEPT